MKVSPLNVSILTMKSNSITINCLAFQLSLARKKIQKWYEDELESFGLNTSYVYVMEVLTERGPCSLTLIAEDLQLEKATVSNLLARMERDGFIHRMPGKERRSMEVHLSEKGKKVVQEALCHLKLADMKLDEELEGQLAAVKEAIKFINNKV